MMDLTYYRTVATLGTAWSLVTSFLGICGFLGISSFQGINVVDVGICIIAAVGGAGILFLSLCSEAIWKRKKDRKGVVIRCLHVTTVACDAYFTFLGTAQSVSIRDSSSIAITISLSEIFGKLSFESIVVLFLLTIIVTASPITLSKLI